MFCYIKPNYRVIKSWHPKHLVVLVTNVYASNTLKNKTSNRKGRELSEKKKRFRAFDLAVTLSLDRFQNLIGSSSGYDDDSSRILQTFNRSVFRYRVSKSLGHARNS